METDEQPANQDRVGEPEPPPEIVRKPAREIARGPDRESLREPALDPVRASIERYFHAVDTRDRILLIDCFCEDAEAEYHCMTPEHKTVVGGAAIGEDVYASCCRFTSSIHSIANLTMAIIDDHADVDTFAIAHVVLGARLLVRGLRYQDRLQATAQGWRIRRRQHTPIFQAEMEARTPILFNPGIAAPAG